MTIGSGLVKHWGTFPDFWKTLFSEWFKLNGLKKSDGWTLLHWKKGLLFNSYFGAFELCETLNCYREILNLGLFTWEEMALAWDFLPNDIKTAILQCYPPRYRRGICDRLSEYEEQRAEIEEVKDIGSRVVSAPISCKALYTMFNEKKAVLPTDIIAKWERDLGLPLQDIWLEVCRKVDLLNNVKIKNFHILFLNRGYHYNAIVNKYSTTSEKCTFCGSEEETIIHLFWNCSCVNPVWKELIEFCKDYICTKEDVMNQMTCLMSMFSNSLLVLVVTMFKWFIHLSRLYFKDISFKLFLIRLKSFRDRERLSARYARREHSFERFWNVLVYDEVFEEY